MAYEIGFKFNPGTTVYIINRTHYSILKGIVVESKIKTFTHNDSLNDRIQYIVRVKSKTSVVHTDETTTFATYVEAWTALYNFIAPTPTPTK